MTWADHHRLSESSATAAHEAIRYGDKEKARSLFAKAASYETQALSFLSAAEKPRTFGITAVSAVALFYKARELAHAERLAHSILTIPELPPFAIDQLRELLQTIWNEQAQESAGVKFIPGQVTVSVDGGEIVRGGAPLELVVQRVQTIQSLFYRTAEFMKELPLRRKGPAPKPIQELCRPWLFQSVPGSYQFTVAIQSPPQLDLFDDGVLEPSLVASTFMNILGNAATDPDHALSEIVPDEEYRKTFLKLTRNLTPAGDSFTKMEIRSSQLQSPVILTQESRRIMTQSIQRETQRKSEQTSLNKVSLKGILRAVHLEQDWLELIANNKALRINEVGETIDDIIGPMVNHEVIVQAIQDAKGNYKFQDIELRDM